MIATSISGLRIIPRPPASASGIRPCNRSPSDPSRAAPASPARGCVRRNGFRQTLLMWNPAEHVLIQHAGRRIEQTGRRAAATLERARHLPVDVAVHAVDDFRPERRLGDMGIDVDDKIIMTSSLAACAQECRACRYGCHFGQLAHAQSAFAVLAIARHGFRHGASSDRGAGAGRASAMPGKISAIVDCEMLAAAASQARSR